MRAGAMDRRITIQQNVPVQDSHGAMVPVWSDFTTVWAQVKVKGGKESFDSDQTVAETTTVFKIRYLSAVNERMRILYNGGIYDIQSPLKEIGRQEGLEITATANNVA